MKKLEINMEGAEGDCEPKKMVNLNFYRNMEIFWGKNMFSDENLL